MDTAEYKLIDLEYNHEELKSIVSKVEILQKQLSNFRDKILNQK